jgi:hypothetical protein
MKEKVIILIIGVMLLCSVQIAVAQKRNSLAIAVDHLVLKLDLKSPKSEIDSALKMAGIAGANAAAVVSGNFGAITNDGWTLVLQQGNLIEFDRSLVDLNANPQSRPYMITSFLPDSSGRPGYPGEVKYGVNAYSKVVVYGLASGLTRFILPGYQRSKRVFLSGNFNNWSTLKGMMQKTDGGWIIDVKLGAGVYEYKYIVDGRWINDPENLQRVDDGADNVNSVFYKYNYTFKLKGYTSAKKITVAGDFNNHNANELVMDKKAGGWEKSMYVNNGSHNYRFFVDGNAITDPANPAKEKDDQGNLSSVLKIGEPVVFNLKGYLNAKSVVVAGDFNNWNPKELSMKKSGDTWKLSTVLSAGNYSYKFIVDGKWITDPANPHKAFVKDQGNSFLVVKPNFVFRLKGHDNAKMVTLNGVFNNWEPNGYTMAHNSGEWNIALHLKPGKYLYKFRIDGNWIIDPGNKLWEPNEFGTGNSVLWIE